MKTTKTIEVTLCDSCSAETGYQYECDSCKKELCSDCTRRVYLSSYPGGTGSGAEYSGNGTFCHSCQQKLIAALRVAGGRLEEVKKTTESTEKASA